MKIPVFVSSPTALNAVQMRSYDVIINRLNGLQLEPRRLGESDYPTNYPLREIAVIAQHCSGGVILGFEQFRATKGIIKRGTKKQKEVNGKNPISFPTPWNHLEAGILFSFKLPMLIFREPEIRGGVFDEGVTDVFIHKMPDGKQSKKEEAELNEVFLKWYSKVSEHYFQF